MKTLKLFLLRVLESLEFGWQVIRYALIFVSAFFRQRASLGCEMVAMRSQLTFYEESIRQKRQPRPRFNPAFRLLWVLLSGVWSGWKSATELMKPKTVITRCSALLLPSRHEASVPVVPPWRITLMSLNTAAIAAPTAPKYCVQVCTSAPCV